MTRHRGACSHRVAGAYPVNDGLVCIYDSDDFDFTAVIGVILVQRLGDGRVQGGENQRVKGIITRFGQRRMNRHVTRYATDFVVQRCTHFAYE